MGGTYSQHDQGMFTPACAGLYSQFLTTLPSMLNHSTMRKLVYDRVQLAIVSCCIDGYTDRCYTRWLYAHSSSSSLTLLLLPPFSPPSLFPPLLPLYPSHSPYLSFLTPPSLLPWPPSPSAHSLPPPHISDRTS